MEEHAPAVVEQFHSAAYCRHRAHHAGIPCTVDEASPLADRVAFSKRALVLWQAKQARVEQRLGRIPREARLKMRPDVTCDDLLAGNAATTGARTAPGTTRAVRTRRRAARRTAARSPGRPSDSGDDPPLAARIPAAARDRGEGAVVAILRRRDPSSVYLFRDAS